MPSAACPLPPKPPHAVRVLHTADWHLGKMLGEMDRLAEHKHFLDFLLETLHALEVDVLLVCGDIFDSANPPQTAVQLYFEFLAAVHRECQKCRCSTVIIAGNHDSPAHLAAPAQALAALSVHVVSHFPENAAGAVLALPCAEKAKIIIAAVPFLRDRDLRTGHLGQSADEIQQDLRAGMRRCYQEVADLAAPLAEERLPVIATGHLTVVGARRTESERDIHIGGLGAIGPELFPELFSYVALGHLHAPQSVEQSRIRYAGSPIPLSFGEAADVKEMRLLEFQGPTLVRNEAVPIPLTRRLVQLRVTRETAAQALRDFAPEPSPLRAWVEVLVTDGSAGDLYERVKEWTGESAAFEVIQVRAERSAALSLALEETDAASGEEDLLLDPRAVFLRRLDLETGMAEGERAMLETAFDELLGMHAQEAQIGHAATEEALA